MARVTIVIEDIDVEQGLLSMSTEFDPDLSSAAHVENEGVEYTSAQALAVEMLHHATEVAEV